MMSPFSWSNAISTASQPRVRNFFHGRNVLGSAEPAWRRRFPSEFVLTFSGSRSHPERHPVNVLTAIPFIGLSAASPLRFVFFLSAYAPLFSTTSDNSPVWHPDCLSRV